MTLLESDPESEVDLSNLIARVSSLSTDNTSLPYSSHQAEDSSLEADIDRSLSHLHQKQRERNKGLSGRFGEDTDGDAKRGKIVREEKEGDDINEEELDKEIREKLRQEREDMRKDKEKAEALRGESGRSESERELEVQLTVSTLSYNTLPKHYDPFYSSQTKVSTPKRRRQSFHFNLHFI